MQDIGDYFGVRYSRVSRIVGAAEQGRQNKRGQRQKEIERQNPRSPANPGSLTRSAAFTDRSHSWRLFGQLAHTGSAQKKQVRLHGDPSGVEGHEANAIQVELSRVKPIDDLMGQRLPLRRARRMSTRTYTAENPSRRVSHPRNTSSS